MARYWLSYDLGLGGSYDGLYTWLAQLDARECGDGVATFTSDLSPEQMKRALKAIVGKMGRVYLVGAGKDGKWRGQWLIGARKPAPWVGHAQVAGESEDEA